MVILAIVSIPSLLYPVMKACVFFFVLYILAFASPQDVGHKILRSNKATSSPTRGQKTPPSHTLVPTQKSSKKVPTGYLTHRSHSSTIFQTRSQVTPPKVPTWYPSASPKIPVKSMIGITSQHNPKRPSSRGSYPTSTQTPKSSPPSATTPANSITTQYSSGTPTLISASRTLTVSNGQTASAQVGWIVVGVGIGGAVYVGGSTFLVPGGTEVIINSKDEPVTIETSTTRSTSSSSSTASPTPYNIYPNPQSTRHQQSAFARNLERIAQPDSVKSITGGLDQLLLWVASLTPAQASELSRNPVVSV